jgi:hypothetical protein
MAKYDKETVLKYINNNFQERLTDITHCFSDDRHCVTYHKVMEKAWTLITHKNSGVAYSLFKDINCAGTSLEAFENLSSFAGNLVDDAYFGIEYDTDGYLASLNESNSKVFEELGWDRQSTIHTSGFSLVWCNDNHHSIVYEKDMAQFLDWFITYADGEFIYDNNGHCEKPGPLYPLGLIKDWDKYPKQLKSAYDHYNLNKMRAEYGVFG